MEASSELKSTPTKKEGQTKPPRAALKRFKQFLESGNAGSYRNRNFDLNVERINDFIGRPEKDWSLDKKKSLSNNKSSKSNVAGIYEYTEMSQPSTSYTIKTRLPYAADLDPMLGMRSRMGDGDGTKWDQWILTATDVENRLEFDLYGMPRKEKMVTSGFKRHYLNHPITFPEDGTTTVKPYHQRRQKKSI